MRDELHPVSDEFLELSRFAEQVITKRIEQLDEVAMVDMSGGVDSELLVIPDEALLRQAGITMADVERALRSMDISLGSLTIRDGEYQYNVKFKSVATSAKDVEELFLKVNDRLFRLRELAKVVEHPRKRQGMVTSNGKDAVTLAVVKQSDARMSDLKEALDEQLQHFSEDYPDVEFTITRDQTELLDYSINNLIDNILVGIILACIIILFFMRDMRSPVLVILTIPNDPAASAKLSQRPGIDELFHLRKQRDRPLLQEHSQLHPGSVPGIEHFPHIGSPDSGGLFAEHMDTVLHGINGDLMVPVVGHGQDHRVAFPGIHQSPPVGKIPHPQRRSLSALIRTAADGRQPAAGRLGNGQFARMLPSR